jgi:glycosyltransferase involved in cell wall biosynthesis
VKLIIQIPCLNEEQTLPMVFADMPSTIPGVDSIEYLVIDDGSTDQTVKVAEDLGVTHFVRHTRTMGLGLSFHDGMLKSLELGADILVSTDGDNQYPSGRIPDLIQPILAGDADIVIGDRRTGTIDHFSPVKKRLQRVGSRIVSIAADAEIPDAASGFRAYSREALIRLNPVTRFSYCMETIIQAGNKRLAISSIPVQVNPKTRESRLFKHSGQHVVQSAVTIVRAYIMYKPLTMFVSAAGLLFAAALVPFVRFLVDLTANNAGGVRHLQSLLVGAVLMMAAFLALALGVIADLIRINRILTEDALDLQKRQRFSPSGPTG